MTAAALLHARRGPNVEIDPSFTADRILGWLGRHRSTGAIWFDGGVHGRGFFGVHPSAVVQGRDLRCLDEVENRWRRHPDRLFMGWLEYESGSSVALSRPRDPGVPAVSIAEYDAALEVGRRGVTWHGDPQRAERLWRQVAATPPVSPRAWPLGELRATLPQGVYRERVAAALQHLRDGDAYQVNLSQPFFAPWRDGVDPRVGALAVYAALRARTPAPMGGFVETPAGIILSNSPETLLEVRTRADERAIARSWPIKGTRPRHRDPRRDAELRAELRGSEKDAAEHVMIVDLVRNDLGRLAAPGTVRASQTPTLVTLPTVHHLVTEVSATLRPGWSLRELVTSMFPGGSITGAPKHRSMQIIDELEGVARGIYCGSLFLLHPGGIRLSIAIRTALTDANGLTVRGGGGIVIDSDPELERLETVAKVAAFAPHW